MTNGLSPLARAAVQSLKEKLGESKPEETVEEPESRAGLLALEALDNAKSPAEKLKAYRALLKSLG